MLDSEIKQNYVAQYKKLDTFSDPGIFSSPPAAASFAEFLTNTFPSNYLPVYLYRHAPLPCERQKDCWENRSWNIGFFV
jgi:hypothetical protein